MCNLVLNLLFYSNATIKPQSYNIYIFLSTAITFIFITNSIASLIQHTGIANVLKFLFEAL